MSKMLYRTVTAAVLLSSCTYNISMVHTEGQAHDVIDSAQEATPDVRPTVNIPVRAV